MIRSIFILVLFITVGTNAQEPREISKYITLEEEYTIDGYSVPKEIIFFSSGHYESEKFYQSVFDRLKKKTKKENISIDFVFQRIQNWKQQLQYYNKKSFKTEDDSLPVVCFYEHGPISTEQLSYCKDGKCEFYFYVSLVDVKNNEILLKRKYRVKSRDYYYTQCKNLADEILKELQIL